MKARGWRVFATARKAQDIARLRDEVGVESLYLDYAEPRSIAEAPRKVIKATDGKLTALFNNGTYGQPGAVEDLKPDVLRAQFEAAVFGWHDLTPTMIPAMTADCGDPCDAPRDAGEWRRPPRVLLVRAWPHRRAVSRRLLRRLIRPPGPCLCGGLLFWGGARRRAC